MAQTNKADEAVAEIEKLWHLQLKCRSVTPRLTFNKVDATKIRSPSYYVEKGFSATVILDNPITDEDVRENHDLAHYLNQNFILRLDAVLEDSGQKGEKIKKTAGWECLDLVRCLRNIFMHGNSPLYSSTQSKVNPKHHDLAKEYYKKLFNQELNEDDIYSLPIDRVLEPIVQSTLEYFKHLR